MNKPYRKYFKPVPEGVSEIDVYMVHKMFNLQDPSGALHHASKKILLCGERTGGKSKLKDITEARDALSRWINIHKDEMTTAEEPVPAQEGEVRDGMPLPVAPHQPPRPEGEFMRRITKACEIPERFIENVKLCAATKVVVDFYVELHAQKKMILVVAYADPVHPDHRWNVLYSDGGSFHEKLRWTNLSEVCAWLTSLSRPCSWATRGRRAENLAAELQAMFKKPVVTLN
ncbi:hypothetical protein [Pseudomonas virus PBPA162]|uniref:Uncharacterized protein n=1 Tax=Pseudomonas virus PBPA162 TaxID=2588096 RepID=A0A4Y5TQM6_9CAUD|nr:hypothetical protein PQC32_gp47 [Pseudomonas virus PBPA162]QDB70881.1 hypothetical protein [Pseudomonas virus PBPA162]